MHPEHRTAKRCGGLVLLGLPLLLSACGARPVGEASPSRLTVSVLPLDLPGIDDANYALTVKNGANEVVWSREASSNTYGDGAGSLTFVGACDADSNPNKVELLLTSLTDTSGVTLVHPADFFNPTLDDAGNPDPLVLEVECKENEDVRVTFDVTVMRSANQGFFDIGVTFSDIFCSAKLDCLDAFLHDGGVRKETLVVAFACTSGQSVGGATPSPTFMYYSDVTLACTGGEAGTTFEQTLTPIGASAGNQGEELPALFQWAQYYGEEELAGMNKCYWNLALGLDMAKVGVSDCTLTAYGTASDKAFTGNKVPADAVYPVIKWEVPFTVDGNLCEENKLNEPGSGVQTVYAKPGVPVSEFVAAYECGASPTPLIEIKSVACGTDRGVEAFPDGTIKVSFDGSSSAPMALPSGWTVENSCCSEACCK